MTTVRRAKWHPPPPPTPRILHLPRRSTRRKHPAKSIAAVNSNSNSKGNKKPERLFDEERAFSYSVPPVVLLNSGRRERVNEAEEDERESGEEKWRFQAEMLRAECNLLRMEREIAIKKLHKERGLLHSSLKSALHTLLSGKKKIREGKSVDLVIEEEIEGLARKLVELQRGSKMKHSRHNSSSSSNFDKQASLLQKELEKLCENGDKDIEEISASGFSTERSREGRFEGFASSRRSNRFADVETLRRKMERLSKGKLLKRMEEEYGSMLGPSANASVSNSASTSKRHDLPDSSSFPLRLHSQSQEGKSGELRTCSGHCKAIVRRIMEQVRAETEQWSQMQEMLGQVREEMEELQASRDFWEKRALESSCKIETLNFEVEEWTQKALSSESKENQLHEQVRELQQELEKMRIERSSHDSELKARKDIGPISLGAQLAREKRLLSSQVKGSGLASENRDLKVVENTEIKAVDYSDGKKAPHKSGSKLLSSNRHPFKDIGNLSPLMRQNSRRSIHPLHSPQDSQI